MFYLDPVLWVIWCRSLLGATFIHLLTSRFCLVYNIYLSIQSMANNSSLINVSSDIATLVVRLFPISQVKLFIALNNNVDIRGLWLNVYVSLLFCLDVHAHMKNDSPENPKAVTYGMISLSPMKINILYPWQQHN